MNPETIVIMEAIQNVILPLYWRLMENPTKDAALTLHEKIMDTMYAAWRYARRCERWGVPVSDEEAELFQALENVEKESMRIFRELTFPTMVITMRRIG